MEGFYLDEYIRNRGRAGESGEMGAGGGVGKSEVSGVASDFKNEILGVACEENKFADFRRVCAEVYDEFAKEWKSGNEEPEKLLELQKKAITGCVPEVSFFKKKISLFLREHNLNSTVFPYWYDSLEDAVYHENWGVAAIAEWFSEKYKNSSSAKIIGDRIYFLEGGRMALKPQKITEKRREQLVRAFLMLTPEERLDKDFHEVYMRDGTRVTIFRRAMVKKGQDVIIFRRYVVPSYTFEEQAERGTIPKESIALFEDMVSLGYNVAFTGAVRTAKSTFLSTWQAYENRELEGVMIETDPEIPMEKLMPEAPIVQLIADGDRLSAITKNLLRSDADYFIMAEARDGAALDTVLRAAAKGTRRMKITFHSRDPLNFSYDVAQEIVNAYGGDVQFTAQRTAAAFDYIFHFIQLKDKSQKRLKAIYELRFDRKCGKPAMKPVCLYDMARSSWEWFFDISDEKREMGLEEDAEVFARFEEKLRALADSGTKGNTRYTGERCINDEL